MTIKSVSVFVGHVAVNKCELFGHIICAGYNNGRKSTNLEIKSKPLIHSDPQMQYVGRVAEYAAALYFGLDPNAALDWKPNSDSGYDFKDQYGRTFDVKATRNIYAKRLIWPVSKIHKLQNAAQVFIFAKVYEHKRNDLGQVVDLVGWITKEEFIARAKKAVGRPGIIDGSLYVDENDLNEFKEKD